KRQCRSLGALVPYLRSRFCIAVRSAASRRLPWPYSLPEIPCLLSYSDPPPLSFFPSVCCASPSVVVCARLWLHHPSTATCPLRERPSSPAAQCRCPRPRTL